LLTLKDYEFNQTKTTIRNRAEAQEIPFYRAILEIPTMVHFFKSLFGNWWQAEKKEFLTVPLRENTDEI